MDLFDTHCHVQSAGQSSEGERATRELWAKAGDTSVDEIVERAHAVGVRQMICVGCDLKDSELAIEVAANRGGLFASIGIHPHEAQHYSGSSQKGLLDAFAGLVDRDKVVAVGECGLDYFYSHSPKEQQIEILKFQMDLAVKHHLPMIFHVREAFDDFWPIFDEYAAMAGQNTPLRGVLHSFTDSEAHLAKALERGLYIGVNGIATFAKNPAQLAMYRAIPLKNLLLETDAPFLTPSPHRGTICEPYHISVTASFLANLRGDDLEGLATASTSNAQRLFNVN